METKKNGNDDRIICPNHLSEKVEYYCEEHDEYLCERCYKLHETCIKHDSLKKFSMSNARNCWKEGNKIMKEAEN